jgi:maleate cis-trans isomerase
LALIAELEAQLDIPVMGSDTALYRALLRQLAIDVEPGCPGLIWK